MSYLKKLRAVVLFLLMLVYFRECTDSVFHNIDRKYHLVYKSHNLAKALFTKGRTNYDSLKNTSVYVMDTFVDLVQVINNKMAKQLRNAVIKFYKIKNFHDYTNYMITLEEMIDIIEHCLIAPVEMFDQLREQFYRMIMNFEDVRHFDTVNKCHNELPDEVAVAHCILHQAVLFKITMGVQINSLANSLSTAANAARKINQLTEVITASFNETMQDSLVSIVEIKTYQHARRINASLYDVKICLNSFVPNFFDQLLIDTYTDNCGYLKIVNASIRDLMKDEWRKNKEILFPKKWSLLLGIFKEKFVPSDIDSQQLLLQTMLAANLTSQDIIKTLYL